MYYLRDAPLQYRLSMNSVYLKSLHAAVISLLKISNKILLPSPTSTVPFDMEPEILPEGAPVPLNDLGVHHIKEINVKGIASLFTVVPLNPKPWLRKWENLATYLDGFRCQTLTSD